jgi:hypothetical protein
MVGAIRLLGKRPLDAADDRQVLRLILDCSTLDGDRPDPFAALWESLTPRQVEAYRDRLRGRGLAAAMSASREEARRRLLEVVDEAFEGLEVREATWREREAARGDYLLFDDSAEAEWLRRQQGKAMRGILRIVERFRAARRRGEVLSPDPPGPRSTDRRSPARVESIDRGGPSGSAPDHRDRPEPAAPDPGLAELHDPQPAPFGGASQWSDPIRHNPTAPASQVRRPDPHTPSAAWSASRGIRLTGAVLLLLPFLTAARPTEGSTPADRPVEFVRPADRAAWGDARDPRSPGRPALDAVPTLLNTGSRPRNRQNEPISPASRVRNRRNEPFFAPDSPLIAVRRPDPAGSADRSRGPPRPPGASSWLDRPSSQAPDAQPSRPRAPRGNPAGRHVTQVGSDP